MANSPRTPPGEEATCTEPQTCTVCNEVLTPAKGHTPGAEATCTTAQICTVCGAELNPAKGHTYTAKTIASTCTEDGYSLYTCTVCSDSYKDNYTASRSHWYGLWSKSNNGTHSADCVRCGYALTVDCAMGKVSVVAAAESGEIVIWDVCPVCGRMGELQLLAYEMPVIKALESGAIPGHGEPVVLGLEAPFDGALYALTATYEYAGKVEPLNGLVEITIPVELEAPLRIVRVDVTPAPEETERTEAWTEIPFSYENGKLTFETDIGGLFLLIPIE